MGLRYRKSIKICKGLKLNLSKSGISTSVKVGRVTHNTKRGTTVNLGNGLSYHMGNGKKAKKHKVSLGEKLDKFNENNKEILNSMENSKLFNWVLKDREKALKEIKIYKKVFYVIGIIGILIGFIDCLGFLIGIPALIYGNKLDYDKLIEKQQKNFEKGRE